MKNLEMTREEQQVFEAYLLDTMESLEKQRFEQQLSNDTALYKKFQDFKQQVAHIEELALRTKLEEFHKEYKNTYTINPNSPRQSTKNLKKYMVAASIALIAIVGGTFFFSKDNVEKKLFDGHFSPDPGLPTVMGDTENYAFYEAMVDYKQENYEMAIAKWEKLLQQKPSNDTLNYFLGAAYLAKGEGNKSIYFFNKSLKTENSVFRDNTYFYLGLAQLKAKNKNLAAENFKKSSLQKSKVLLKELKNGE